MKKFLIAFLLTFCLLVSSQPVLAQEEPVEVFAQTPAVTTEFERGVVLSVSETQEDLPTGQVSIVQQLKVRITTGAKQGTEVETTYGGTLLKEQDKLAVGDHLILSATRTGTEAEAQYMVVDHYRLPALLWLVGIFLVVAFFFGRLKGVTSVAGLAFSLAVLIWFAIPRIVAGQNAILVAGVAALIIAIGTIYLAHGFTKRTSVAVVGTVTALALSIGLALLAVQFTHLSGHGSPDAFELQFGPASMIDLRNLLLAGIIIASLGILDDITTAQAAAVDELKKANPSFGRRELYRRAMSIGREHIASLVNTLVLVYVGSSLPILIVLNLGIDQPQWVIANTEFFGEEVVKAVVGSLTLVLAVPLTTILAAHVFSRTSTPSSTAKGGQSTNSDRTASLHNHGS